MEVVLADMGGLPEDSVISIRVGGTRRQAPASALGTSTLRFPTPTTTCEPLKVDVLQPVVSHRLVVHPGVENYRLDSGSIHGHPVAFSLRVRGEGALSDSSCNTEASKAQAPRNSAFDTALKYTEATASARQYLEGHRLLEYLQGLLTAVVHEKPVDPYRFFWDQLGAFLAKPPTQIPTPAVEAVEPTTARALQEPAPPARVPSSEVPSTAAPPTASLSDGSPMLAAQAATVQPTLSAVPPMEVPNAAVPQTQGPSIVAFPIEADGSPVLAAHSASVQPTLSAVPPMEVPNAAVPPAQVPSIVALPIEADGSPLLAAQAAAVQPTLSAVPPMGVPSAAVPPAQGPSIVALPIEAQTYTLLPAALPSDAPAQEADVHKVTEAEEFEVLESTSTAMPRAPPIAASPDVVPMLAAQQAEASDVAPPFATHPAPPAAALQPAQTQPALVLPPLPPSTVVQSNEPEATMVPPKAGPKLPVQPSQAPSDAANCTEPPSTAQPPATSPPVEGMEAQNRLEKPEAQDPQAFAAARVPLRIGDEAEALRMKVREALASSVSSGKLEEIVNSMSSLVDQPPTDDCREAVAEKSPVEKVEHGQLERCHEHAKASSSEEFDLKFLKGSLRDALEKAAKSGEMHMSMSSAMAEDTKGDPSMHAIDLESTGNQLDYEDQKNIETAIDFVVDDVIEDADLDEVSCLSPPCRREDGFREASEIMVQRPSNPMASSFERAALQDERDEILTLAARETSTDLGGPVALEATSTAPAATKDELQDRRDAAHIKNPVASSFERAAAQDENDEILTAAAGETSTEAIVPEVTSTAPAATKDELPDAQSAAFYAGDAAHVKTTAQAAAQSELPNAWAAAPNEAMSQSAAQSTLAAQATSQSEFPEEQPAMQDVERAVAQNDAAAPAATQENGMAQSATQNSVPPELVGATTMKPQLEETFQLEREDATPVGNKVVDVAQFHSWIDSLKNDSKQLFKQVEQISGDMEEVRRNTQEALRLISDKQRSVEVVTAT